MPSGRRAAHSWASRRSRSGQDGDCLRSADRCRRPSRSSPRPRSRHMPLRPGGAGSDFWPATADIVILQYPSVGFMRSNDGQRQLPVVSRQVQATERQRDVCTAVNEPAAFVCTSPPGLHDHALSDRAASARTSRSPEGPVPTSRTTSSMTSSVPTAPIVASSEHRCRLCERSVRTPRADGGLGVVDQPGRQRMPPARAPLLRCGAGPGQSDDAPSYPHARHPDRYCSQACGFVSAAEAP